MVQDGAADEQAAARCFDKALELLARRSHFRVELERKLRMRKFSSQAVASAVRKAADMGYLDDLECARQLARSDLRRKAIGPAKLRARLSRRGAGFEEVNRVVGELFSDGEQEMVKRAAESWLRIHTWERDKLARHLNRQGFSKGAILSTLGELADGRAGQP